MYRTEVRVKSLFYSETVWAKTLTPSFTSCMDLSKLLNLSMVLSLYITNRKQTNQKTNKQANKLEWDITLI